MIAKPIFEQKKSINATEKRPFLFLTHHLAFGIVGDRHS